MGDNAVNFGALRRLVSKRFLIAAALVVAIMGGLVIGNYVLIQRKLARLYTEGDKLFQQRKYEQAHKKFSEAQRIDPYYQDVRAKAEEAKRVAAVVKQQIETSARLRALGAAGATTPGAGGTSGGTSSGDTSPGNAGGSPGTTTPGSQGGGGAPGIFSYLPASLEGYRLLTSGQGDLYATRLYEPERAGDVKLLTLVVEQMGKQAGAFLNGTLKTHYSENPRTFKVNEHNAYFGTDGKEFALLAWDAGGGIMVELEMQAAEDDPSGLLDEITAVGKAMP